MPAALQSTPHSILPERVGHCYSRSKEAVAEAIGAIYSRTKEAFRENISGKHIDLIRQGNCLRQSLHSNLHLQSLDSTFGETDREKHFEESPISFEIGKSCISANRRKHFGSESSLILSHSLSLALGFFRETNSKQSASLYIRQDSIDMLHSLTQGHAHTAIGCNQKLMHSVPRRGLQSYDYEILRHAQIVNL